jgi:ATP-dependent protease HslVU (ClpYQ) ATPase subunit
VNRRRVVKGPTQIVVRVTANQYADLNAVAGQFGKTVSEIVREMVEENLPRYKEKAAVEGAKLRADKELKEQIEEATYGLVEDLRRGRLVLFPNELTAPKALALAELIARLRPGSKDADPLVAELRAGLLRALNAAPDASLPEPPPKPQRIRKYSKRKTE